MMNLNVLIVTLLGIFQPFYTQAELSIVSFDSDCPTINPEYLKDVELYLLDEGKDNEYHINFTLIQSFPRGTMINFKIIGATMGEYKVPTGFDVSVPSCDGINEPIIGSRIYDALGITGCPVAPGTYANPKMTIIETDTLPDTFPPNKYLVEFSAKYEDTILFLCRNFFIIQ